MSGRRNLTTVAPQALFLMNSKLLQDSARSLAENLSCADEKDFARAAYRKILGRSPSADEVRFSLAYLAEADRASLCQVLMCSSQFLYVD